jgi:hypothetical protein
MTIRTGGAQQVGDAVVAGRMFGGGELGAVHGFNPPLILRDRRGKYCH